VLKRLSGTQPVVVRQGGVRVSAVVGCGADVDGCVVELGELVQQLVLGLDRDVVALPHGQGVVDD
jgi:hypothetical protein